MTGYFYLTLKWLTMITEGTGACITVYITSITMTRVYVMCSTSGTFMYFIIFLHVRISSD